MRIKFYITEKGDRSAGILPFTDTVVVETEHDFIGEPGEFEYELGLFLKDWFDTPHVETEAQFNRRIIKENKYD